MSENDMVVDAELVAQLEAQQPPVAAEPEAQQTTVLTAEEVIGAFEVVYEELVILRNSVINLHERLSKLEPNDESGE